MPVVADSHHFDEESDLDPHQSEKSGPDPHQIEKSASHPHQIEKPDPNPHQRDADLQHRLRFYGVPYSCSTI
jgi:hypothetical protein